MSSVAQTNNPPARAGETPDAQNWLGFAVVLAIIGALYYTTFTWLVESWTIPESNYSHGFWVPLVLAYFIWEKRAELAAVPSHPDPSAVTWVGGALAMHLAGLLLDVHFLSGLSLIVLFWGLVRWYFGKHVYRLLFWPAVFLIFMIPLPLVSTVLTIRLQLVSAVAATGILQALGFDVMREGTMLTMPSFSMFVEAPCSGLNTLFSLIFVGSIVAYLARGDMWRKVVLLCTAPLIAVIANVFRIVLIGLLGEYYGEEVAMGVFHKGSGIIMYSVGLVLFILEGWLLKVKLAPAEAPGQ